MTLEERVLFAQRLCNLTNSTWKQFVVTWAGFNTLYNSVHGGSECWRAMQMIKLYVPYRTAERLLNQLSGPISYFAPEAPGNMQLSHSHPAFRQKTNAALRKVKNPRLKPVERLAYLISVVYQVRCNLLHGDKDPYETRDRALVANSLIVLDAVVPEIINSILHET